MDPTKVLEAIAKRGRQSDVTTARFAIRDAIADSAHLHNLRADSAGLDKLVDYILASLSDPSVAWAIEGIVQDRHANR